MLMVSGIRMNRTRKKENKMGREDKETKVKQFHWTSEERPPRYKYVYLTDVYFLPRDNFIF